MFGPRRCKQIAAFGTILFQMLILLTGNYTFFNLLTVALCLFLLDDRFLSRISCEASEFHRDWSVRIAMFPPFCSPS